MAARDRGKGEGQKEKDDSRESRLKHIMKSGTEGGFCHGDPNYVLGYSPIAVFPLVPPPQSPNSYPQNSV